MPHLLHEFLERLLAQVGLDISDTRREQISFSVLEVVVDPLDGLLVEPVDEQRLGLGRLLGFAGVHTGVGRVWPRQVLLEDDGGRLGPGVLQLDLVELDSVQKLVVVVVLFFVSLAELPATKVGFFSHEKPHFLP